MRRNLSKNKMLNISVIALFLAVSFAGCLENDDEDIISPNDVVVNPVTLVAGEFQPLVISAKRDVSVFIPHMVVDPASNYLQNGTILAEPLILTPAIYGKASNLSAKGALLVSDSLSKLTGERESTSASSTNLHFCGSAVGSPRILIS